MTRPAASLLAEDRNMGGAPSDPSRVPEATSPKEQRFVLARFLQLVQERLWLLILLMIGFGVGGAVLTNRMPDKYEGRATLLVEAPPQIVNFDMRNSGAQDSQIQLNTLVQSIRNTDVMDRVVRTNRLTNDLRFTSSAVPLSPSEAAGQLSKMLVTRLRPGTRLIDITVRGTNAPITAILARSVAVEFIADREARTVASTRSGATALEGEAVLLAQKVRTAEKTSLEFREKHEILSLRSRSESVAQTMTRLNTDLTKARSDLEVATEDTKSMVSAANDMEKLLLLKSIAADTTVVQMRQQVISQELVVAGYTNRYKPAHPKRISAEKLLEDQRQTLLQLARHAGQNLEVRVSTLRTQIQRDEAELTRTEAELKRISRLTGEYSALEREVETDTALLQGVLKRGKELDLTTRVEAVPISLAEASIGSGSRVGPQRTSNILISVGLGLAVGIGFLYLLQRIDSSLRTVDEVEERLGLPVLGAVAVHRDKTQPVAKGGVLPHLVTLEDPTCVTAEGFRSLRTLMMHLGRNDDVKVQLFTSAVPNEGKSFCATNHAATLAKAGHRVVLIDLDLRRPTVGSNFGIPVKTAGVSSFLLGQKSFAEIQHVTAIEGLTVIPAGPRIPNPAEQLTRPYLGDLLRQATAQFDFVVIDSAPVNPVSDTLSFLGFAQVVLMVIHAGKTAEPIVQRALLELRRAGNPARGIVLNRLPRRSGRGNYYYYYSDDGYYSEAAAKDEKE